MKLRAKVTRSVDIFGYPVFKAIFPRGAKNDFIWESILRRNLGSRPYAELSYSQNGERIRIWSK